MLETRTWCWSADPTPAVGLPPTHIRTAYVVATSGYVWDDSCGHLAAVDPALPDGVPLIGVNAVT
jgi:hypothetical protein